MTSTNKRSVTIPPYIWNMLASILMILFAFFGYLIGEHLEIASGRYLRNITFIFRFGVLLLTSTCFHYKLSPKGITVCFLYIPVRRIGWNKISTAQFVCQWTGWNKNDIRKGQGIFITSPRCPIFCPEIEGLDWFRMRHPFSSVFIRFTKKNRDLYVKTFKHYYPDMLSQIVCDESDSDKAI